MVLPAFQPAVNCRRTMLATTRADVAEPTLPCLSDPAPALPAADDGMSWHRRAASCSAPGWAWSPSWLSLAIVLLVRCSSDRRPPAAARARLIMSASRTSPGAVAASRAAAAAAGRCRRRTLRVRAGRRRRLHARDAGGLALQHPLPAGLPRRRHHALRGGAGDQRAGRHLRRLAGARRQQPGDVAGRC